MRRMLLPVIGLVGAASLILAVVLASRLDKWQVVPLTSFSEQGVQVSLMLDQNSCTLTAQYTPLKEHFHVYSKDLPPDGIKGLGRPTRLDLVSGLQSAGELSANATTSDLQTEGIEVALPVYPDGPVTLSQPVKLVDPQRAQIAVSFMACSKTTCLPPTAKTVDLPPLACKDNTG